MAAEPVERGLWRCDICGGNAFAPGPGDRLSALGTPPKCVACGSLERHRVLHRLLEALPDMLTKDAAALQVSREIAVSTQKFKELGSASRRSLNEIVAIAQFDWVFALHVLDTVPDEREFLQELLWRTKEGGVVVVAVTGPPFRAATTELATPAEDRHRLYGSDFADHIAGLGLDLAIAEAVGADSVTALLVPIFLLCRQEARVVELLEPLSRAGFYARLCQHAGGADAGRDREATPEAARAPEKRARPPAVGAGQEQLPEQQLQPLRAAVADWKSACGEAPFFLRDDDAARVTPRLQRLVGVCEETGIELMLAIIPGRLQPDLVEAMTGYDHVVPVQHGYMHESHSATELKSEFPDEEALELQLERTKRGFTAMAAAFGGRFMPILVPPWNNISQQLVANLATLGIVGLSCGGRRGNPVRYNVKVFNSWVSLNNFAMQEAPFDPTVIIDKYVRAIRNRIGRNEDRLEPVGLTAHHLVTSEEQFRFLHGLIETVREAGGQWLGPKELINVDSFDRS
jgi:SAM-dependent methyltransferase